LKIYKISQIQSDIIIDLSRYIESIRQRINDYIDFDYQEHERLKQYQFKPDWIIKTLESIQYPNTEEVRNFFMSKDLNKLHDILMDIFSWWKDEKDQKLWSVISPVVRALNDYDSVLQGNKITWTEEYGEARIKELVSQTQKNMDNIKKMIENAIFKIPQWNDSSVRIVASEIYKENDLDEGKHAIIEVGGKSSWGSVPNFTLFVDDKIEIDDVLEGGDDDFFTESEGQADYFNLINVLRNPDAFMNSKALLLYTARPLQDRQKYLDAETIPSNIFLTTSYDFAEGFAIESGPRDVWKIKILDKYLVKTMDAPNHKQYQTVGKDKVPVISITLIAGAESLRVL